MHDTCEASAYNGRNSSCTSMFVEKYVFSLRVVDKFLNPQQIYLTVIKNKEFQKGRKICH